MILINIWLVEFLVFKVQDWFSILILDSIILVVNTVGLYKEIC